MEDSESCPQGQPVMWAKGLKATSRRPALLRAALSGSALQIAEARVTAFAEWLAVRSLRMVMHVCNSGRGTLGLNEVTTAEQSEA
jgi:hypothetical protein